jgi:hypothetical protein
MTSTAVRWVLVDGTTGEGAPIDRGARDIAATFDVDGLLDALLYGAESRIHAVGVTWTRDAEDAASSVLQALEARGLANVVAVSEIEAADALASGIADIAGYADVAVCVVEPDAAVVAMVDADGVNVERIGRPLDGDDAVELTSSLLTVLDLNDLRPDAIFVLGSADLDPIVSSLAATASSPVISAAEADFALPRGAALASAQAVNTLDAAAAPKHWMSRIGALRSVLVAAVVTFVISLSAALGLRLAPDTDRPEMANAAGAPAPAAAGPAAPLAAPRTPLLALPESPAPEAPPPVAKTMTAAVPPAPEAVPVAPPPEAAPVAPPPEAAPVAPPPEAVPIAPPPAYVPPAPPPQPRLRDRIIEHIPIIGRFHAPQYPYSP